MVGGMLALAPFLADGGIVFAFDRSTIAGKFIIIVLLLASGISWSVIITKFSQLSQARKQTERFLKKFRASRKPLNIFLSQETFHGSPAYEVYVAGCKELLYHSLGSSTLDDTSAQRLAEAEKITPTAMAAVRSAMEREVGHHALLLEDKMILLATAVSGGPFLGLLGTVWGVMDAFTDIALAGKASLAAMAPGVSGSLITTVTGLLVAIPAMFGYNYLVVSIRSLTVELDNFAAELAAALAHRFTDDNK
jgi:biopolymer transport protein ExbB/TolQ